MALSCIHVSGVTDQGEDVSVAMIGMRVSKRKVIALLESLDIRPASFYHGGEPGSCFEAALLMLFQLFEDRPDCSRLCHGIAKIDNERFGGSISRGCHAWVEYQFNGSWLVFDASAVGQPVRIFEREVFYSKNYVKGELVDRYKIDFIRSLTARYDREIHCGPWQRPKDTEHDEQLDFKFYIENWELVDA